jgi:hypothetical protein
MPATLTEAELEVIWAAAAALPPPQRAAFQERVAAELAGLPVRHARPRHSSMPAR